MILSVGGPLGKIAVVFAVRLAPRPLTLFVIFWRGLAPIELTKRETRDLCK